MHCGGAEHNNRIWSTPDEMEEFRTEALSGMHDGVFIEGCGRELPAPPDRDTWDIKVEEVRGVPMVVEQHIAILCPHCGNEGNLNVISVPVDPPVPLEVHGPIMNWARAVTPRGA